MAEADTGGLLDYIFRPHNIHFIPLFKSLYYLEYRLFGMDQRAYHVVGLVLFGMSALAYYAFFLLETRDRAAAAAAAGLYSIHSAYQHVVTWTFLQQIVLCNMFLVTALAAASYQLSRKRPLYLAGGMAFLAALSWGLGNLAFPVVISFALLKMWCARPEGEGMPWLSALKRIWPIFMLIALFVFVFFLASSELVGRAGVVFDPARVALSSIVIAGDLMLKTVGLYVREFSGVFAVLGEGTTPVRVFKAALAGVYAVVAVLLIRRMPRAERTLPILGLFLFLLFSFVVVLIRASIGEPIEMTEWIGRYKYFPFMGLVFTVAAGAAALRRRYPRASGAVIIFVFALLAVVHYKVVRESYYSDGAGEDVVRATRKEIRSGASRYGADPGTVGVGHLSSMDYLAFLNVIKLPEDRVVRESGGVLLLRSYSGLPAEEWSPLDMSTKIRHDGDTLGFRSSESDPVALVRQGLGPSGLGHLAFDLKSDADSWAELECSGPDGLVVTDRLEVGRSIFHKEYILPCRDAALAIMRFGPGGFVLGDFRLYK